MRRPRPPGLTSERATVPVVHSGECQAQNTGSQTHPQAEVKLGLVSFSVAVRKSRIGRTSTTGHRSSPTIALPLPVTPGARLPWRHSGGPDQASGTADSAAAPVRRDRVCICNWSAARAPAGAPVSASGRTTRSLRGLTFARAGKRPEFAGGLGAEERVKSRRCVPSAHVRHPPTRRCD